MAITPQKVDRVHFGQFLKINYLSALHSARRAQLADSEAFEKRVVMEFMDSLYSSSFERRFTVDAEIYKYIIEVLIFIQNDHLNHRMIPYHETIDRMESGLSLNSFQYILARYRAMTGHYYNLYVDSTSAFTLSEGLLPEGVTPVKDMVRSNRRNSELFETTPNDTTAPTPNQTTTTTPNETTTTTTTTTPNETTTTTPTANANETLNSMEKAGPIKKGRGRPRKINNIQTPVQTETPQNHQVDDIIEETPAPLQTKKRGRPPKVKATSVS